MQKSIILFLFIVVSFTIDAQDDISIQIGMNYGNAAIKYEQTENNFTPGWKNEYIPGIVAGLTIEEKLGDGWRMGMMLQYSQKGFKMVPFHNDDDLSFRFDFADGLLFLERRITGPISIYAGGNYSYRLRSNYKEGNGNFQKSDNDDFSEKQIIGGLAGVKLYFGNIALHGHWNRSFTPIHDYTFTDDQGETVDFVKEYLQSFQFGLTLYL